MSFDYSPANVVLGDDRSNVSRCLIGERGAPISTRSWPASGGGALQLMEMLVCVRLILGSVPTSVRCLKSMGFASTGALFWIPIIMTFMRRLETLSYGRTSMHAGTGRTSWGFHDILDALYDAYLMSFSRMCPAARRERTPPCQHFATASMARRWPMRWACRMSFGRAGRFAVQI